jgi:hypothetical protein
MDSWASLKKVKRFFFFKALFSYFLPSDSGEKINLIISILLIMIVFLHLVADLMPKASMSLPVIG